MPDRVKSTDPENRLRCTALKEKLLSADDAAWLIEDGMTVAVSGFTPAGCPKAVPLALAEQVRSGRRTLKLTLFSGASTGEELDSEWASLGIIARRAPYMTSKVLRTAVNSAEHEIAYSDHIKSRHARIASVDICISDKDKQKTCTCFHDH